MGCHIRDYSISYVATLRNAGFQVLTDPKYLTSADWLERGDILLNEYRQGQNQKSWLCPLATIHKSYIRFCVYTKLETVSGRKSSTVII